MSPPPDLPLVSPAGGGDVPVFNCVVLLRTEEETSRVRARAANLDGVVATGATERDALMAVSKEFKTVVQGFLNNGEVIPFLDPPRKPESDEQERFLPIHL